MTSTLQRLIDALRDELQQHGEVLAWLDAASVHPEPQSAHGETLQFHLESLLAHRARRETLQHQLAWACQRPDALTPAELLPRIEDPVRPLVSALFEELDSLHAQFASHARRLPWLALLPLATQLLSLGPPGLAAHTLSLPVNIIVLGALSA